MASKEYKITLPNGVTVKTMANSAHQAGKRAEKAYHAGKHVVNQKDFVSNVTRKSVADAPGVKVAKSALEGRKIKSGKLGVRTAAQKAASKRNLESARRSR